MKRSIRFPLFGIFAALIIFRINGAMAECQVFSCGGNDSVNASANGHGSQCFYCNDNYAGDKQCKDGDVVGQVDPQGRITNLVQCQVTTWDDYWNDFNPSIFCPNSDIGFGDPDGTFPNSYKSYSLDYGNKTIGYVSGDDTVLKAGNTACVYIKCNSGYMPNSDRTECIEDNRETQCISSGGSWNGTSCTCSGAKNLKPKSDGMSCECINSDYEFDSATKQCKKKQSVINEENNQRQRQQNQQRQTACQNSGGTWKNNQCVCDENKNLRTENNVCVCLDDTNYRRQGNECILTDAAALQRDCDSDASRASGAYWDATNKQCLCSNPQHVWRNKVCVMNPAIENCQNIPGAAWNASTKTCYCTDSDKELNAEGTACVETDEAKQRREDENTQAAISTSTRRIEEAGKKLDSLAAGFKTTVWKTAEGKFNTSRLASDSIAGVVLGTAGGLITSNVMKKNQVENGFEDIQCTVGGQVVAGWGDEFRVGIQ